MSNSSLLPEWAPVRAVLIAWPYPGSDWQDNLGPANACYLDLLEAFSSVVDVWVLLHDKVDQQWFSQQCVLRQLPEKRIHIERSIRYNDTWTRDYGPLSLQDGYIAMTFNGWGGKFNATDDNRVSAQLQSRLGRDLRKFAFVGEGGALETNGQTLLVNADCAVDELRNPGLDRAAVADQLGRLLGISDIEWVDEVTLTGDDTDGHIDTIVRFSDARTLVYAGRNPNHPDAETLNSLHQQVSAIAERRNWRTFELPSPLVRSALDGRQLPATYANFLIVNETVFVPVYGVAEDTAALKILAAAFESKTLVPVRCEALLEQHGSLHCATMQIADLADVE